MTTKPDELPALPTGRAHLKGLAYTALDMLSYGKAAIAADRASRQVANKAEVDLSSLTRYRPSLLAMNVEPIEGQGYYLVKDVHDLLATPPATTGASTARDQALEEAARICDQQATEPECPERAGYCAEAIRALKGSVGASTVLTDERIEALLDEILQLASNGASHGLLADDSCSTIVAKINSVKAAPCTNSDSWNCKYCPKTADCAALKDKRNFGTPVAAQAGQVAVPTVDLHAHVKLAGDLLMKAHDHYKGAWIGALDDALNHIDIVTKALAAPSPAKESK